jgi:hypothetical protein
MEQMTRDDELVKMISEGGGKWVFAVIRYKNDTHCIVLVDTQSNDIRVVAYDVPYVSFTE